ncbi:threonine/homoserine efflux transporter RhtA [Mesorhizobium sp. J18]|uniref:DMT family transporter n=1 Tax=Mesorhizobium sp. J18 TaxID=935263 RepID=UPI00119C53F6|nr:DMT family transporter [Mesorhizobium sp. J18]TWG98040.1 threonine/homoserine efflux transporter RhtA [Mesorhizobium sp. J18]
MHRTAYLLLLLTMLFWAGNAIAGKLAVGHISPMLLVTLRWLMAAILAAWLARAKLQRDWPAIRSNLPFLFLLGTAGFTGFNAALYSALNFTTAINVSIEQAGLPMVIFLANFLLFRMKASWLQILGVLLTILGIGLTASHGDFSRLAGLDLNLGDALMILAVLSYGGYSVALRFKPVIHWTTTILVLSIAAFISSIPFAAWEYAAGGMILPDKTGWAIALFTAIFPSILGQVFYIWGNEMIGSNRAGLFINLVPIFGTLLSILLLGEAFEAFHAVAIVLVLGGIWLAEHSGRKLAA